jgi:toxin CcdB
LSQFDVHRNTGRHAADIPFVVVVQSAAFDKRKRRIVVPLVLADRVSLPPSAVNPVFAINGIEVVLNPLEITSVAVESLGEPVGTLTDAGDMIVAALDEVFSRAWG